MNIRELKDSSARIGKFYPVLVDNYGNISFGIDEYVHVPGLKYNPKIPMFGFNITITLERPGYSIKRRRLEKKRLPRRHIINQSEAIEFMKKEYGVTIA